MLRLRTEVALQCVSNDCSAQNAEELGKLQFSGDTPYTKDRSSLYGEI